MQVPEERNNFTTTHGLSLSPKVFPIFADQGDEGAVFSQDDQFQRPAYYPRSFTFSNNTTKRGLYDGGAITRALFPLKAEERLTVAYYTGPAGIIYPHTVCFSPDIINVEWNYTGLGFNYITVSPPDLLMEEATKRKMFLRGSFRIPKEEKKAPQMKFTCNPPSTEQGGITGITGYHICFLDLKQYWLQYLNGTAWSGKDNFGTFLRESAHRDPLFGYREELDSPKDKDCPGVFFDDFPFHHKWYLVFKITDDSPTPGGIVVRNRAAIYKDLYENQNITYDGSEWAHSTVTVSEASKAKYKLIDFGDLGTKVTLSTSLCMSTLHNSLGFVEAKFKVQQSPNNKEERKREVTINDMLRRESYYSYEYDGVNTYNTTELEQQLGIVEDPQDSEATFRLQTLDIVPYALNPLNEVNTIAAGFVPPSPLDRSSISDKCPTPLRYASFARPNISIPAIAGGENCHWRTGFTQLDYFNRCLGPFAVNLSPEEIARRNTYGYPKEQYATKLSPIYTEILTRALLPTSSQKPIPISKAFEGIFTLILANSYYDHLDNSPHTLYTTANWSGPNLPLSLTSKYLPAKIQFLVPVSAPIATRGLIVTLTMIAIHYFVLILTLSLFSGKTNQPRLIDHAWPVVAQLQVGDIGSIIAQASRSRDKTVTDEVPEAAENWTQPVILEPLEEMDRRRSMLIQRIGIRWTRDRPKSHGGWQEVEGEEGREVDKLGVSVSTSALRSPISPCDSSRTLLAAMQSSPAVSQLSFGGGRYDSRLDVSGLGVEGYQMDDLGGVDTAYRGGGRS